MKLLDKYIRGCVLLETPPEEIRRQYQLQKEHGDWTLYSERAFIEQLFSTRFNYFVATFSLLAAAVTRIEAPCLQLIALLVSAIILTLMGLAIYRVYVKLIIILKMLYQLEDYQVFRMIDREVRAQDNKVSMPVNQIIGVIVPLLGTLSFWCYFIYALFSAVIG